MHPYPILLRTAVAGAVVVALGACADLITAGGQGRSLTLSFGTPGSASASRAPVDGVSAAAVPITIGGHTLDLTGATLGVSKIELETASGASLEFSCKESKQCSSLVSAPLEVDLAVNGGVVTLPGSFVPAGTYRELEVRFSSVRLRGTYDAQPFDVVVPVNVEQELEFNPPVTIGATGQPANVTIQVPTALWLRNSDGSIIDPRQIATNATLRAQVANRIRATLRAFRDDDRDDNEDDARGT